MEHGSGFAHLHVHTEYSLLDGAARIKQLVKQARQMGMTSLAITDHGVMHGVVEFYQEAVKHDLQPVIGCEVYVAPRSRFEKQPGKDDYQYHLVLLAENNRGYRNLMGLVSAGFLEGFYYKPRVDRELLSRYSEGLIALSGCLAGEVSSLILQRQFEAAREAACYYRDLFGPKRFYLELQDHGLPEQSEVNHHLEMLGREEGIPLVATNDVHYLGREDQAVHDVLLCIQTGKTIHDEKRLKFKSGEFYFKNPEQMRQLFASYPEALDNTLQIAGRCRVDFEFGKIYLPNYQLPSGAPAEEFLRRLCLEGLARRYNQVDQALEQRLDYELTVINQMGYASYFLIVWDLIRYAKNKGILVGPGRGSAAGSLVSYCLGITNIDPIRYNLIFERFLNPERISMPDIDIDFSDDRRDQVLNYVVEKYGQDRVAQIITFGTMAARAAVRDVGRALAIPYGEVDRIAKLIPFEVGMTISKALEQSAELKAAYREDSYRQLLDTSLAVEGAPRHASVHAAGVVISREPLVNLVPLQKTSEGAVITQFPMGTLEKLGLLKMDFLGLKTLGIIGETVENIKHRSNLDLDIEQLPLDDPPTYQLLSGGGTAGIFQLESSGMRSVLKELQPNKFEDIIAVVALYRPGPMEQISAFVSNKHASGAISYYHPALESILKETYGIIVYQEQIMQIASQMAGFTLGQADLLRRAIGKKKKEILDQQQALFEEGCLKNGYDKKLAVEIYNLILKFASYGFNKSHAAAYAMLAYQTAYLKANYPVEFMAALMTGYCANSDKVALYIADCRRQGIEVLPPDINESEQSFTVVGPTRIRFGLMAVKNLGLGAIESIITARRSRQFGSLKDFTDRVDLRFCNRKVVESLVKSGAFDSLGGSRAGYLAYLEEALAFGQSSQRERDNGQISLFTFMDRDSKENLMEDRLPDISEFKMEERLGLEKEMLGLYISGHPLEQYRFLFEQMSHLTCCAELEEAGDSQPVTVGGIVKTARPFYTKKGRNMSFITLEDLTGSVEVIVFPELYQRQEDLFQVDRLLIINGKTDFKEEEEIKLLADSAIPLPRQPKQMFLKIGSGHDMGYLLDLKRVLSEKEGNIPVYLLFEREKKMVLLEEKFWAAEDPHICRCLEKLLGAGAVTIRQLAT